MVVETWSFPQFEVAKSEDGLTNVVKVIHWRFDMANGQYSAWAYGSVALTAPDPASFIPYEDITEAWAIEAASSKLNMGEIRAALDGEIEKKKNPAVVSMKPPF